MDVYHKVLIGVGIGLLAVGGLLGRAWLDAHDAQLKAEAQIKADQTTFDKLTQQQKDLAGQLEQVRKDQQTQTALIDRQFNAAQTPQQFAGLLAQLMGLKTAPIVVTPAATPGNPNPVPVLQLPDAPAVKTYFQACEDCKANQAATAKELALVQQEKAVAEDKLSVMTQERDTLKKSANGGPWIKRAGRTLKVAACAALGGAAGGQRNATGAALGALGGAVACSLF